ncbi:MAG: transglutaminase TgpA family protein [Gammaproteobacteria bacterium]
MADPAKLRLGLMLAALLFALVPAALRLPSWIIGVFAIAALWRLAVQQFGWRLPPGWLRLPLAFACVIGVLLTYRTFNGLEAGGALLVVMAAMKLLETRTRRDLQVLSFIGFFIILAQLLYDQPIWSLPWLLASVIAITVALLQGVRGGPPLPLRTSTGIVLRMLAFAVPVALVLFLLFPRVPGPFWALPSHGAAGLTGLSDEMSPGQISQLIQSDEIAFRVSFDGPTPPPAMLYWRGPVLERFDGWTWRDLDRRALLNPDMELRGPSYRYRITIEPHGRAWLLALDYPGRWSDREALLTHAYQLVTRQPIDSVRALEIESWPAAKPEPELSPLVRMRTLQLPDGRNPRTAAFARELRAVAGSDDAFVDLVLAHFRNEPFVYTLQPPMLTGGHPVDEFMFRARRGFCEHYASAFTMLARAAGLPARVVTGYQGGETNPISNRLVVRQSEAHAWSEVWLEGRGWTRVDPTGAVAPNRVELSLAEALPSGERVPGGQLRGFPGFRALSQSWDALDSLWTDWVLGYGPDRQLALLARLGLPGADWRTLVIGVVLFVTAIMLALSLWLAWRLRPPATPEALRLYREFCRRLEQAGLGRAPQEGPQDFAARIATERPALAQPVARVTRLYTALRYEAHPAEAALLGALRHEVRSFRP